MYYYRLDLVYDGRAFQGWQTQPHHQTIQDHLNNALKDLDPALQTLAAGRTDAGVHALKQVVRLSLATHYPASAVLATANAHLPPAIRVGQALEVAESFHPLHNAGKEYRYFWAPQIYPWQAGLITPFDYPCDLGLMQAAAQALEGRHDFAAFACQGTPVSSTVREIYKAQIEFKKTALAEEMPLGLTGFYQFTIVGSGFLKQMVRLLMGGIFNVGRGKVSLAQWAQALPAAAALTPSLEERSLAGGWHGPRLGPVAPPDGLYLANVFFTAAERDARVRQLALRNGTSSASLG